MRPKLLLILILLFCLSATTFACDICGCGVGSYYIGLLPEFKKRFVGIRHQYKGLRTNIGPNGTVSYLSSYETYQTLELWGAFNLGKKFRVLSFLPYNINQRSNTGGSVSKTGLGDIVVNGYFQLINQRKTLRSNKLLIQNLWIGAGIKLPTGSYNPADKNPQQGAQNSFQLGTGSTDFTMNAMYDLRVQDFGINTNLGYKLNTTNKYNYSYGNKFTINSLVYYKMRLNKNLVITPNSGCLWEAAAKDQNKYGAVVFESGGKLLMAAAGAEIGYKNIGLGGSFQSPLHQQLAENTVRAKNRFLIQMTVSF
jgi:hypothetical protein